MGTFGLTVITREPRSALAACGSAAPVMGSARVTLICSCCRSRTRCASTDRDLGGDRVVFLGLGGVERDAGFGGRVHQLGLPRDTRRARRLETGDLFR